MFNFPVLLAGILLLSTPPPSPATTSIDHPLQEGLGFGFDRDEPCTPRKRGSGTLANYVCTMLHLGIYTHVPSLRFCSSIHPIPHDTIQSTVNVMLQPGTLSRLSLPSVDAGTLPFCCFSFSSNFANSARATSSSWSRT